MNENIENNEWVNEAPTLAAMEKRNPFFVPDGYFENCDESVFSSIFIDGLKQKTNENSFDVPQHYFEELTERIETRIALTEMVKAKNTFTVPENYFDTLQSRITNRIAESEPKKEVKVVSLWKRNLVKYASAACFLLISSFGIYFYQTSKSTDAQIQSADMATEQMLYDIDENTIIEHIESLNANSSKVKTTSASDTELETYILNNYSSSDLSQELNN